MATVLSYSITITKWLTRSTTTFLWLYPAYSEPHINERKVASTSLSVPHVQVWDTLPRHFRWIIIPSPPTTKFVVTTERGVEHPRYTGPSASQPCRPVLPFRTFRLCQLGCSLSTYSYYLLSNALTSSKIDLASLASSRIASAISFLPLNFWPPYS